MDVRSDVQRFGIGVLVLMLVVFAMVALLRSPDLKGSTNPKTHRVSAPEKKFL